MKILAIETSCDETCAAIVEDGWRVHANVIASQIPVHQLTGGVVPEVASREHMKVMMPVVEKVFEESGLSWEAIDAVAVTKEPGLVGSLIVGRMTAAALAFAKEKPLIEVNHIHGHLYSNWLGREEAPVFPVLSLTVSGGHNELVLMRNYGEFELLGETLDDAAGEAFDKVARLLGLGYPGGPAIEKHALEGNAHFVDFPIPNAGAYDFSFSGLKTAVLYYLKENETRLREAQFVNDVAASFQRAAVETLVSKLLLAMDEYDVLEIHLAGGVSANKALRAHVQNACPEVTLRYPENIRYCTDNAAMIGAAAYYHLAQL